MKRRVFAAGRKPTIIITAGPTRERLDPVRFISNYSTGEFGYALAREALKRGLKTVLISGPTAIAAPRGAELIKIESAADMRKALRGEIKRADYLIMAAAVSDWRAALPSSGKIKKTGRGIAIKLKENPDILAETVRRKRRGAVIAGFALETGGLERNALLKLKNKGLDLIVANRVSAGSSAFGHNNTNIIIMDRLGNREKHGGRSKAALSKIILDRVLRFNI